VISYKTYTHNATQAEKHIKTQGYKRMYQIKEAREKTLLAMQTVGDTGIPQFV